VAAESRDPIELNEPKLCGRDKQRIRFLAGRAVNQAKWAEQHSRELQERRQTIIEAEVDAALEIQQLAAIEAERLLELDPSGFLRELVMKVEEIRTAAQQHTTRPDFKAALQAVHDLAALIKGRDGAHNKLWLSEHTEPEPKKAAKVNGRTVVTTAGTDTTDLQAIKAELAEQERVADESDGRLGDETGAIGGADLPTPIEATLPPCRQDEGGTVEAPAGSSSTAEAQPGSLQDPSLPPCPACLAPNALVPGETLKGQLWLNCLVCGRKRVKKG